jgi:hypothetical protein
MSTHTKAAYAKKKTIPSKTEPQAKNSVKPQPMGLSREEVRQIVLEMIG